MMVQNTLLTIKDLLTDDLEPIGLTKVEFNGEVFYRITPSQSPYVTFHDGFYPFEFEQHGRWCSEHGRMTISLDVGEWQVVVPIAGEQIVKAPSITSTNSSLECSWVEGGTIWAAAVVNVSLIEPVLKLEFQSRSCFIEATSDSTVNPRHLGFWMLDELLFRPRDYPLPATQCSGLMPSALRSDIENAQLITALDSPSDLQNRIRGVSTSGLNGQVPVRIIHDGVVVGRPSILGFYSAGQLFFLRETVPYQNRLSAIRESCTKSLRRSTRSVARFDQVAALCCEWSENIWHWFSEYVPKAMALEEAGFSGIYLVPCNSPVFRDSLMLLGVDYSRIREFVYDYVEARELFVTEQFSGHELAQYPRLVSKINDVMRKRVGFTGGAKRLYIARRGTRRVINESEVLRALDQYNFQLVYMEDHTITEQIGLAANADCIAGPHGAGMTFVMFMKPGGTMLEFFAPTYVNPCMNAICSVLNIAYLMVASRNYIGRTYAHGLDIEVDVPLLNLALRTALGNS
jgi:hypothetical protein